MIFDGTYEREYTERSKLSWKVRDFKIDNPDGECSFKFLGKDSNEENQTLEFNFKQGKVYDFDGVFVNSYTPSDVFEISIDLDENYYNYSINGESIEL